MTMLIGMKLNILVISFINDYYSSGKEFVIDKDINENVKIWAK